MIRSYLIGPTPASLVPTESSGQSRSPYDPALTGLLWRADVAGSRQHESVSDCTASIPHMSAIGTPIDCDLSPLVAL